MKIGPAANSVAHIQDRWESLITFDAIRIQNLLETLQYGLLYLIAGFLAGSFLDTLFPLAEEKKDTIEILGEVIAQSMLLIITIYYVRKLVKVVPFMFQFTKSYRPYGATEYSGEVMIAIVLIGSQFSLLKKIDILSRRFYKNVMNVEKELNL